MERPTQSLNSGCPEFGWEDNLGVSQSRAIGTQRGVGSMGTEWGGLLWSEQGQGSPRWKPG